MYGIDDIKIVYAVSGACGGLIRTINFIIENPKDSVNYLKVFRNIILGGFCGFSLGVDPVTAFTAGMTGEYLIQNIGAKAKDALMPPKTEQATEQPLS